MRGNTMPDCVNESNALHDDLVRLEAPLINCILLTLPRRNMHQYERAVTKIKYKKIKNKKEQSYDTS